MTNVRALAGFLPHCAVLLRRLARDPRVPRSRKLMLAGTVGYLAFPLDVIPDFIPIAGQIDDALVVAYALRAVVRAAGPDVVAEHWPGPDASLRTVLRLAGAPLPGT